MTPLKQSHWLKLKYWLGILLTLGVFGILLLPVMVSAGANRPQSKIEGVTVERNVPSNSPLPSVKRNGWYYPALYLGPDDRDTVQSGEVAGRPFQTTVTGEGNLISGSESGEMEFHGRVDGPNVGGWDLWNDEHCLKFDFRAVLTLTAVSTANIESRFSRIDVSSGGFAAVEGRLRFYDADNGYLGALSWSSGQDGQVKTANVNWNRLRYVDV